MKQVLLAGMALGLLTLPSFSQVNSLNKFGTTGSNVIAYKQGTSCTASAYSFYMISDAGLQAGTPFYTLANTSREVNGIGINPVDRFLYGVEYDRDEACAFYNFHLKRYDTQGNSDDLGTLPPINGGSVTAALGCVTNNGNFIYSTKDAAGNSHISMIANVASLPVNATGTLTIHSSTKIINNAASFNYADWAVHPTNAKMYSYGIANIGGVATGKVLELDPATGVLQTTGLADATDFLDVARDNFGGVYFGNDGMLYGVNINTRKLYKIDPVTGAATYRSTMIGSGQIRADMGSYATGWIILPVTFTKTEVVTKGGVRELRWAVASVTGVKEFVIEQNNGKGFFEAKKITVAEKTQTDFTIAISNNTTMQYRVKAIGIGGGTVYSPTVVNTAKEAGASVQIVANPVRDGLLRFVPVATAATSFSILSSNGQVMKRGIIAGVKNAVAAIGVNELRSGVYLLHAEGRAAVRFVVE